MDAINKQHIRQDLQDHLDRRAFGLGEYLAAGEKSPINPVNPVKNKKLKIESIQHPGSLWRKILRLICYRNYA